jgi:alpha-ketoglutarate-dependent taurine dioxygenase
MTTIAPEIALSAMRWTAESLERRENWKFTAPTALAADARALSLWATTMADPVVSLARGTLDLPSVHALAAQIAWEVDHGTGVAWVRGVPPLDEQTLRLLYLALGLELGTPVETYGRLYDVADSGASYKDKPIPVSQTRESTGMHTDSSGKSVFPRVIGLLCIRPAPRGGNSRIVSAAETHERLRATSPALLERLYGAYVRDVVTPGADRSPEAVAQNRFPIFAWQGRLVLRYMRYWIERGHERAGVPLGPEDIAAFDALDRELSEERNVLTFRMEPGEMLFIDNTTSAHDRDAYEDDPAAPRLLVRLWLDRPLPLGAA